MQTRTLYSSIQALLAFIGTADAGTLFWADRNSVDLPCTSGGGCALVAASHWSHIGPVPVALFGLASYVIMLFASVLKLTTDSEKVYQRLSVAILGISIAGAIYSWYLQWVADYYIGAFCIYCRVSAITITIIALCSLWELITLMRRRANKPSISDSTKNL